MIDSLNYHHLSPTVGTQFSGVDSGFGLLWLERGLGLSGAVRIYLDTLILVLYLLTVFLFALHTCRVTDTCMTCNPLVRYN